VKIQLVNQNNGKMNRFGIAWVIDCVIIGPTSVCYEQLVGNGKLVSSIQNVNFARSKAFEGPFAIPIS